MLSVNPDESFAYVLVTDREKPADQRPEFFFRYLRAREADQVEKNFEASKAADTDAKAFAEALAGVRIAISGWKNVRHAQGHLMPFDPENVDLALERADILELRDNVLHDMTVSRIDKKKYAFASQSITAASASATPPASA